MQLLYLYIDDFRTHKAREFNFDSNYRFTIENRQLRLTRKHVVPREFFRVEEAAASHVDAVSAIIGENGTGKTSVAAFLNEALAMDTKELEEQRSGRWVTRHLRSEKSANVLLFLDEAETTLHPDFQRRLVETLTWYIEHFTSGLRVHLVFASHSPMLLSDIPKGNVVFLPTKRSPEAAEE